MGTNGEPWLPAKGEENGENNNRQKRKQVNKSISIRACCMVHGGIYSQRDQGVNCYRRKSDGRQSANIRRVRRQEVKQ